MIGKRKYKIVERLGHGGMAEALDERKACQASLERTSRSS
jgi:hypothetical protein